MMERFTLFLREHLAATLEWLRNQNTHFFVGVLLLAVLVWRHEKGFLYRFKNSIRTDIVDWLSRRQNQYILWLFSVSLVFIWFLPQFPGDSQDETARLYLLSTISQSLAALLGLILAALFVATQLSVNQSVRAVEISHIFTGVVRVYLLIFVAAVAWPLMALADPTPTKTRIAMSLVSATLIPLLPFILYVIAELSPVEMIERLVASFSTEVKELVSLLEQIKLKEGEKAYDRWLNETKDSSVIKPVEKLVDYLISALVRKDYATFEFGFKHLLDVFKHSDVSREFFGSGRGPLHGLLDVIERIVVVALCELYGARVVAREMGASAGLAMRFGISKDLMRHLLEKFVDKALEYRTSQAVSNALRSFYSNYHQITPRNQDEIQPLTEWLENIAKQGADSDLSVVTNIASDVEARLVSDFIRSTGGAFVLAHLNMNYWQLMRILRDSYVSKALGREPECDTIKHVENMQKVAHSLLAHSDVHSPEYTVLDLVDQLGPSAESSYRGYVSLSGERVT